MENTEIKFSAKTNDSGDAWAVGYYVKEDKRHYIRTERGFVIEVRPETLVQSTCFKDCAGKEIYNGWLIKETKEGGVNNPMLVRFGKYEAGKNSWGHSIIVTGWHIIFSDGGEYSLSDDGSGFSINSTQCVIVGNMFENPELQTEHQK